MIFIGCSKSNNDSEENFLANGGHFAYYRVVHPLIYLHAKFQVDRCSE